MPEPGEMTITITVVQAGLADIILKCPGNLNKLIKDFVVMPIFMNIAPRCVFLEIFYPIL